MNNNLIIIIIFIIILVFIYVYEEIKKEYNVKVLRKQFWKDKYNEHHKKLLDLYLDLKKYLDAHKLKYWAHAGTLLGVIRHNGFIPWDDDLDLGFLDEIDTDGNKKIDNLIKDLENNGFIIIKKFFGYQVYNFKCLSSYIDLFRFTFDFDNQIFKQDFDSQITWPKENYYVEELFPLKKGNFKNIELPMPKNTDSFCSRAFGKDYINVFYIKTPHNYLSTKDIIDTIGIFSQSGKKFYIKDLI